MTEVWQWLVAAAFAPAALWLLWRVQVLSVELLRRRLVKLVRTTKWLYSIVSWFGTLLHELSHATVLMLSGHGIREFRVRSETGHVTPRRASRGPVAFLSFLAAAIAPLYLPPALVLVGIVWLVDRAVVPWEIGGAGLAAAVTVLTGLAVEFPQRLMGAIASLDLARPAHLAVFLLILLGAPGSRPSHVRGSRFHGRDDEGDVAVLRKRIRQRPIIFVAFLLLLYGLYFALAPWWPAAYWWPFQALWAVALTGIVLALFGAAWWSVAHWNTQAHPLIAWVPPVLFVLAQATPRLMRLGWDTWLVNAVSVAAWLAASLALRAAWPRRRGW